MSIAILLKMPRNAAYIVPHSLLSCKEMNLLTESPAFSMQDHLSRISAFNMPLLLILWHISSRGRGTGIEPDAISKSPSVRALFGFLSFAGLLVIAISLSILASCAGNAQTIPLPAVPETLFGFFVLFLSCLSTAYLEEGFFRFYFFRICSSLGVSAVLACAVSALAFASLHIWEGFWGAFNALFAAVFLSFVYLKTKSLHVIALAHTAYDIFAYIAN
jgi:membrane protease YdiL (CAAX protease family)